MKNTAKKTLALLLSLVLMLGLLPGMSLTAYADNTCTVTFKANGRTVSKEVTLPHTFSCNYSSENGEFDLIIKELYQLDGGCCGLNPPTVSGSTNVTGGISGDNQYITVNAPFEGTATFDSVYFDSSKGYMDFEIHLEISCTGAVAAYSVTITPGSNMTKTSGEASQTGLSGPMTDVVYTANEGYYFPENYSVAEVNGISVTRDSYTQITVSGTPTADAAITLTAPTEKTTPAAPTTAAAVDCTTSDNNDGKLTGVTAAMEYKKSDAADWTAGTGSDITGLVPGTYYVRVKATDTTNASGNQELTINAAQTQTDTLLTTITATDKEKASYNPENVASVSFSYTAGGSSAYLANWGWWGYGWTATVNAAEGYTITKCVFYDDANRKATDSEAPFVVETTEEDKTPRINGTPIDGGTSQSKGLKKIEVYGYATPAATHSVTITAGDNMTKTADSGDAEQTGLTGAMTDVVYTADEGYYFPTDYSVAEVSRIKVTRDSYTQITVSGTPTADAAIALTAPTAKTTPDVPTTAAAENCTTADNNDGKLTGVTTAMEYKKSDAESWIAGTGSDITGLVPGTYYVRFKATDTTNASDNQELSVGVFAPTPEASINFLGGSLRRRGYVATGVVVDFETDLRFGFSFDLPEGAVVDTDKSYFRWKLNGSATADAGNKIVMKNGAFEDGKYVSNMVITGVPKAFYQADINCFVHLVYKLNDMEFVVEANEGSGGAYTRSVEYVCKHLLDNSEWGAYAQSLLDAIS